MKKTAYLALLLCMVLLLTGCTSETVRITKGTSDVPLPEVDLAYEAPVGDAALSFTGETTVYVPSHDGVSLNSISLDVGFSLVKHDAESIVRAMLAFTGSGMADSLGNGVKLSLYGSHPVEVSRNTVTINLGASALRLNRNRLYLVGQAFAETLTQLPDVKYVNLLITGKPVGMDTANTLPMGAFATASVKDINGVYEQLLAHRVSADETAAEKPFVANVTLYYPLEGLDALVCDTRSISFDNQTIGYMVS